MTFEASQNNSDWFFLLFCGDFFHGLIEEVPILKANKDEDELSYGICRNAKPQLYHGSGNS